MVTQSSSFPVGAFRSRHQALRALRADPVRSFDFHGGANGRGERLPITGDAAHAFAPRALRDPDGILTGDTARRHRARGCGLTGGPMLRIEVGQGFHGRPDVVSDRLQRRADAV